ncbi:3-oxoacyl-[acyl-carrier-protein] reductase [Herbinix hemicellulosilytica]|uniref:3-oxoacyl-[acyl-carrier-protein] reductase n=1 Tax=Herbinix hemicellulosilytica TaxID=1564487 RepID=A0A0H5SDU4_HERHM|nr:3-oxoacyl-[acyl-carrier-protein] reductase [Herbinix hemicellulosilytica]RBP60286.1 3-oxoacyl-[acyl-carrier-protein] reductase [Herbinix hemicellulosilytica]CRZ33572.1 3-oxoacyl-[acyl-carrier-protein] reductase FabG [Herbinix hemicellulosilytica]
MLKEKIAVITGAGRGIGRAIALQFAEYGAKVVLNYRNSLSQVEELIQTISRLGGEAIAVKADVSREEEAKYLIEEAVKKYNKIDILVNNAGINKDNLLMRMTEEEFDAVMDVNLKGTFFCMKHAAKIMLKQRYGKIINISSVVGLAGNIGQANYAASKAGVIGLTKSAARELARKGITVNAVAPGFIKTDMTDALPDKVKEASIAAIPMGRFGEASEVAGAVCFLASEAANYITGQVLSVDGGMVM